jgi:hypothetical protein
MFLQEFGVVLFDSTTYCLIPIVVVTNANRGILRRQIEHAPFHGQGTNMYTALRETLLLIQHRSMDLETWIICLTDGESGDDPHVLIRTLGTTPTNIHFVSIGVNLNSQYEQQLEAMSHRFNLPSTYESKGFFVRCDNTARGMDEAFAIVKSRIPVSQTFDRDGAMTDNQCREFIEQYLPQFVRDCKMDMLLRSFWVKFLYRRVSVFDKNEEFNYNTTHDALGESLMEVMLEEVHRLLAENQRRDWKTFKHAQLVYDFTNPDSPAFRLVCTSPDAMCPDYRKKLSDLKLPGFRIPTKADLENGVELQVILSQALDLPLGEVESCIQENQFILTIDFVMKLLGIHERVSCRVPCVLEGETGVSKTALTKMYSKLINCSQQLKERKRAISDLQDIESSLLMSGVGHYPMNGATVLLRLIEYVSMGDEAAAAVMELLKKKIQMLPVYASAIHLDSDEFTVASATKTLRHFADASLEQMMFEINVDASQTEEYFVTKFENISRAARKVLEVNATVVVFLDGTYLLFCVRSFVAQRQVPISANFFRDQYVIGTRSVEGNRGGSLHCRSPPREEHCCNLSGKPASKPDSVVDPRKGFGEGLCQWPLPSECTSWNAEPFKMVLWFADVKSGEGVHFSPNQHAQE